MSELLIAKDVKLFIGIIKDWRFLANITWLVFKIIVLSLAMLAPVTGYIIYLAFFK